MLVSVTLSTPVSLPVAYQASIGAGARARGLGEETEARKGRETQERPRKGLSQASRNKLHVNNSAAVRGLIALGLPPAWPLAFPLRGGGR